MAKRGRGSKSKGHGFERKIAKILSLWFFGIPDRLRRTPLSGGFSQNYKGDLFEDVSVKISSSDKVNATKSFPFNVECKCAEVPLDMSALFHSKSVFWSWWKQASTEFEGTPDQGKIPLLVFAKNNIKPMVCLPAPVLKNGLLVPQQFIEINGLAILPLDSFISLPKDQFSLIGKYSEPIKLAVISYPKV